jgi:hypothetical protein
MSLLMASKRTSAPESVTVLASCRADPADVEQGFGVNHRQRIQSERNRFEVC